MDKHEKESAKGMRMKRYKSRKALCRMMRKTAAVIMWIGILAALGTAGRIGLGMSAIQGLRQLLAEMAVMMAAWALHCLSRYIEKRIVTFSDKKKH